LKRGDMLKVEHISFDDGLQLGVLHLEGIARNGNNLVNAW